MAAATNTATTLSQKGNREDLTDILERVAPEITPFSSNIGAGKTAKGVYHEWQTETLATPSGSNAVLEGDDTSTYAENITTRVGNYCQIAKKAFLVSRTQEIVDKAGRKSEIARLTAVNTVELKRDFEVSFLQNGASRAESGSNARLCGGALAWMTSNVSRGASGSSGGFSSGIVGAATNGTQRTLTESLLKTVLQSIFNNTGTTKPRNLYMAASHKQVFSGFPGIASIRADVKGNNMATIYGAADVYMSDFGMLNAIPVAFGLTRDVLIVDHDYMGVSTLDPIKRVELSQTGDTAGKYHVIGEKTLEVRNQAACGVIADLS